MSERDPIDDVVAVLGRHGLAPGPAGWEHRPLVAAIEARGWRWSVEQQSVSRKPYVRYRAWVTTPSVPGPWNDGRGRARRGAGPGVGQQGVPMTRTYQQWRETLNRLARAGPRAAPLADRVRRALDGASVDDEDVLALELAEDETRIMEHVAPLSALWTPNEVVPPQSAPAAASDGAAAQATADAADAFVRAH